MEVQFDSKISEKELFKFSVNNIYRKFTGVIWIVFCVLLIYVTITTWNKVDIFRSIIMILIAAIYIVINPIILWFRSKSQVKKNESFQKPLHYTINSKGVSISQDEKTDTVKWLEMWKAVRYGDLIVIYVSSVRAFILPISDIGDQLDTLMQLMDKGLQKRNFVRLKRK